MGSNGSQWDGTYRPYGRKRKVPTLSELDAMEKEIWEKLDPFLAALFRKAGFTTLEAIAQLSIDGIAPGSASVTLREFEDAVSHEVAGGDPETLRPLGYTAEPRFTPQDNGPPRFDFRFIPGQKVELKKFVTNSRSIISSRSIIEAAENRRRTRQRPAVPSANLDAGPSSHPLRHDRNRVQGNRRNEATRLPHHPHCGTTNEVCVACEQQLMLTEDVLFAVPLPAPSQTGGTLPVPAHRRRDFENSVDRLVRRFCSKINTTAAANSWVLGKDYAASWGDDGLLKVTCRCRASLRIQTQGKSGQPNTGNFHRHLTNSCPSSGMMIPRNHVCMRP